MSWKRINETERKTAKFLRKETVVNVNIDEKPSVTTVEGKYGNRRMYIVDTKEYGAVYVSPIQMQLICVAIGDLTTGYVQVTL